MKTISIDEDLYELLRHNADLEESASSVLRRLLRINSSHSTPARSVETQVPLTSGDKQSLRREVLDLLVSPKIQAQNGAIGRFLTVLGWLYEQDPETFAKIVYVRGRKRIYFAKDAKTLNESGESVNPQPIPGTPYWVVTNNDTAKKQAMLEQVLRLFQYNIHEIREIRSLIS